MVAEDEAFCFGSKANRGETSSGELRSGMTAHVEQKGGVSGKLTTLRSAGLS